MMTSTGTLIQCIQRIARGCFCSRRFMIFLLLDEDSVTAARQRCLFLFHLVALHLVGGHLVDFHLVAFHLVAFHLVGFHFVPLHLVSGHLAVFHFVVGSRRFCTAHTSHTETQAHDRHADCLPDPAHVATPWFV